MIMNLLVIKENMKEIYGKYDKYIIPVFKFIFAFATVLMLNKTLGFMEKLNSPLVAFMIALMCAFLPNGAVVAFGALIILGHVFSLSIELAAIVFVVFVVLLCAFFRFSPREGYMVALTPLLFAMKLPYLVPIIAGLVTSIFSFVPVSIGVFVYYLLRFTAGYDKKLDEMTTTNIMDNVRYILDGLLNNKEMMVFILVFSVTIIIINTVKKFSIDYAWAIASGIGVVINVIMMLVANSALNAGIGTLGVILGNLLGLVLAAVLYVMVFSGDYSRTENVQFEDDDYYYYVKAVPKISVSAKDIKVKKINARKVKPATVHGANRDAEEVNKYSEYEEDSYEEDYSDDDYAATYDEEYSDDSEATYDEQETDVIDI